MKSNGDSIAGLRGGSAGKLQTGYCVENAKSTLPGIPLMP
jgi:hypothetical protein